MLISGKGKYFYVFGCFSKNFPENIFWCLEKKKEKTNPRKISSTIVIRDRDLAGTISRSTARARDGAISVEGEIAINCAISQRWDCDQRFARSRRWSWSRSKARSRSTARSCDSARSRRRSRDRDLRGDRWTDCSISSPLARARSLSLSFFFRKCFELKMRGENHFRVKGENIGQPEVIFRKISFSVTAKHADLGENNFRKWFSPKTNTALVIY